MRLVRRFVDLLVIFAGIMGILYYFGVNPTAIIAGLGVGGIAVALAAQKTLENVIGGISLILDKVVLVGDTLRVPAVEGTVEDLGLRSTRIRTSDRTVVSLPNGQVANMTLENLSTRDKFWFHPILALRYGTTPTQLTRSSRASAACCRKVRMSNPIRCVLVFCVSAFLRSRWRSSLTS